MYGNLLTNRQLRLLINERKITLRPFSEDALKQASYTLTPGRVLKFTDSGGWETVHEFSDRKKAYRLAPNEYVLVEPKQIMVIDTPGILGTFVQTSTSIECGLLVAAGQVDSGYGIDGAQLRFGVKNLFEIDNTIKIDTRLVHVQFIDLRGCSADPARPSPDQKRIHDARRHSRANDDGVYYEE